MSYLTAGNSTLSKIEMLKHAIEDAPKNPQIYNTLAIEYEKIGDFEQAVHYYKEVIRLDVDFIKAYNNIGVILYKQGRYNQAIALFKLSLERDANFVSTYVNLGAACNKAGRYKEGEEALLQAIKREDENAGAYANLGNIYNKQKRHNKARLQHEMALFLDIKSASNHANLGISLKHLGLYKEARECLKRAIMIDPQFVNAHFDLATTHLILGEYKEGFREYEWRFKKPQMRKILADLSPLFDKPEFKTIYETEGKTLVLYTEQGYGDIIQFSRFASRLKAQFPKLQIILQVREGLESLLSQMECFDSVKGRDMPLEKFDYHLALMSLPRLLKLTQDDISEKEYIKIIDKPSLKLDEKKLNIGVVWGASSTGESYHDKVFSLAYIKPFMQDQAIQIYSLQVAGDVKQIKAMGLGEEEIIDLEEKLTDFKQTAIMIEALDLVITSDTSVAHLAGAMGKEVWVVLQKNADWRWGISGEKSLWYESAKLIRQKKQGDWQSAFDQIANMIKERKKR